MAKKTSTAKKSTAKKAPAKETTKKSTVKKAPAKVTKEKTSTVKKAATKTTTKKSTVKKAPAKVTKEKTGIAKKSTVKKTTVPVKENVVVSPNVKSVSKKKADDVKSDFTIADRLIALYNLQQIDTQIDKIRIVRGELPLEVEDLEDEIAGLETRVGNYQDDIAEIETKSSEFKNTIKDSETQIQKYKKQQDNVRNNREFDSLNKEIEFQELEIQLSEKKIKEFGKKLDIKKESVENFKVELTERQKDLEAKKGELDEIVNETEKDEKILLKQSESNQKKIEDRLLAAYTRIRTNARNGLAVVKVERDACGGCFNKIPPQRQLDIKMRKKIIVCEYCGRILVDDKIDE